MRKAMTLAAFAMTLFVATSQAADLGYGPKADPFEQYQAAVSEAASSNKLVLIVAGGDWCRWCHVVNRFIANNDEGEQPLDETVVDEKVYVGADHFNDLFF